MTTSRYQPPRDRIVRIDGRRGKACYRYIETLAAGGDEKATSFLDCLLAGAFDAVAASHDPADSGLRLFLRPRTTAEMEKGVP
jgi:hypothetical protein